MWVLIERLENGIAYGVLDNEPIGITLIEAGMPVSIPLTHVISTAFSEQNPRPETPPRRDYWSRCMVDTCILAGRSHADYLYREEPDMTREGDEFEDSGWRIRGTDEAIADDEKREVKPQYVALGAVLNRDDRWIHLIDSDWPCAFTWDAAAQDYIELDRE